MQIFDVVLVGKRKTGKTCFANRVCKGEFVKDYTPTTSRTTYSIKVNSTQGPITLNLIDGPYAMELYSKTPTVLFVNDLYEVDELHSLYNPLLTVCCGKDLYGVLSIDSKSTMNLGKVIKTLLRLLTKDKTLEYEPIPVIPEEVRLPRYYQIVGDLSARLLALEPDNVTLYQDHGETLFDPHCKFISFVNVYKLAEMIIPGCQAESDDGHSTLEFIEDKYFKPSTLETLVAEHILVGPLRIDAKYFNTKN